MLLLDGVNPLVKYDPTIMWEIFIILMYYLLYINSNQLYVSPTKGETTQQPSTRRQLQQQ